MQVIPKRQGYTDSNGRELSVEEGQETGWSPSGVGTEPAESSPWMSPSALGSLDLRTALDIQQLLSWSPLEWTEECLLSTFHINRNLSELIRSLQIYTVTMYGYENWIIKKAECWRIDAFKLWGWRRLLRVPWTTRRSNQSTIKEINPEY